MTSSFTPNKHSAAGFSLLELIVAFSILALVAGMVFSSLRLSLNSYEKSQERLEQQAVKRVLFDHVKRQIGSLFPLHPTGSFRYLEDGVLPENPPGVPMANPLMTSGTSQAPLFFGDGASVTFVSIAPIVLAQNPGLTVVRYGLAQDEYGDYYLGIMEAPYTGEESFLVMAGSPTGKPLPLVEKVRDVSFQYYGYSPEAQMFAWYDTWFGEEMNVVPQALKIAFDDQYLLVPINATASSVGGIMRKEIRPLIGQ